MPRERTDLDIPEGTVWPASERDAGSGEAAPERGTPKRDAPEGTAPGGEQPASVVEAPHYLYYRQGATDVRRIVVARPTWTDAWDEPRPHLRPRVVE